MNDDGLTFAKDGEEYVVKLHGYTIGRVTKTWHRNGGLGWSTPGRNFQLGKTRKQAAFHLLRLEARKETNK